MPKKHLTQCQREERQQKRIQRQHENTRRTQRLQNSFIWGGANGLLLNLGKGMLVSLLMANVIIEGLVSVLLSVIRQKYLDFSASYYTDTKKIKNTAEKLAFKYGVRSVSAWGWLKSFLHLSTYLHPFAFAGGLEHALERNQDVIAKTLDKPLAKDKRFAIRAQISKKCDTAPANHLHFAWIHFNNIDDLQKQMQTIINDYKQSFYFTTSPAQLQLSKEAKAVLPSFVNSAVKKVIFNNHCIQKVPCKVKIFNLS